MRILVVSQHFWPESFRINEVVDALGARGHELEVLTGQPNYPGGRVFEGYRAARTAREQRNGCVIHRVPLVPRGRGGALRLASNYMSFVLSATLFGGWMLRGRRFDAVFVFATSPILQALPALFIGRIKRAPVVLWVQDLWPESLSASGMVRSPIIIGLMERVVRFIYARSDLLVVQSEGFVEPVRQRAPSARIRVVENPAPEGFDAEAAAPLGDRASAKHRFVFAGNLGRAQGIDALVEAAAALSARTDIEIVVAGSGSEAERLAERKRMLGLDNLVLLGQRPVDEMPALFLGATGLLVTLRRDPALAATVPSKVSAYAAMGRPIVAALDGHAARLVRESGAGAAVPAEDGAALAAAIRGVADASSDERARMGRAARALYESRFTMTGVTARLEAALSEATGGKP